MRHKNIIKDRYKLMAKYIGILIMSVGGFLLLPLPILFFYPEDVIYIKSFTIPSVLCVILGFIIWKLSKGKGEGSLSLKEGGIIVLVSWLVAIISSAFPFIINEQLNFTQAVFESTSGWTTTGLSVVDVTETPKIFLLWRSIMQFFGGAGLVVVMLSSVLHPYGFELYNAEGRNDQLLPHIKKSTKAIMYIYSGYTLAGILLYVVAGMGVFDAINHSIAALSTGGFSTRPESIGYWDSLPIEMITWILMILGTINFATHFTLLKGKFKIFFKNGEIKLMLFIIAFFAPFIGYFTLGTVYTSVSDKLRRSLFEVISAISTTGFSLDVFSNWNQIGVFAMILMMLIGGGTGSTAGGIKLYRIYLMIKSFWWELKMYFLPKNAVVENYIWRGEEKTYIKIEYIRETANYIFIYMTTFFAGVLVYLAHGYDLLESMFEFASSLGTVGLSIGLTSPDAPAMILWTQTLGMILGRLEFLVIIFAVMKIFKDIKYMALNK
ncbi:MAG: TrkH family potassium uptake protein [Fusobacteriota bacterium]